MKKLGVIAILCCAIPTSHADIGNSWDLKGKVWAQYTYDATSGSIHRNGFDIYRAYFQAGYAFTDTWSTVVLLDAQRGETTTGISKANLWTYLRNAYVQAAGLWPEGGTFRFGLAPTLYIPAVDGATKSRWLGKTLLDEASIFSSQNAGVNVTGTIGFFRYGVIVHNGVEGVTKAGNSDSGLNFGFMATVMPFSEVTNVAKGLGLTLYDEIQSYGNTTTGAPTSAANTLAAALHWSSWLIDAAAEYAMHRDKTNGYTAHGYGLTANVKFIEERGTVYLRLFTGNDDFKTRKLGSESILTVGPTWSFIPDKLYTAVLFENRPSNTPGANATRTVMWNWAANF